MEALSARTGYAARRSAPCRSVPGRAVSGRGYRKKSCDGSMKRLITFQTLICILLFFIVIIAKNINITAAKSFTEQIRYILSYNIEMKSILSYVDNLAADIRNSIVPGSVKKPNADKLASSVIVQEPQTSKTPGTDPLSGKTQTSSKTVTSSTDQNSSTAPAWGTSPTAPAPDSDVLSSTTPSSDLWPQEAADYTNPAGKSVLSASSESGTMPVMLLPVNGTLSTPFGKIIHNASGATTHMGIDIHAEKQSSVRAVMDGKVSETGSSPAFGDYIRIMHDNGFETVYAYCSVLTVQEGDRISKGDVIAQIGDQGISAGQHLHFEVWKDGEAVDPLEYISVTIR